MPQGCEDSQFSKILYERNIVMEITLSVNGMKCQGCVDKLEKFVGELEGIERIQVDFPAKSVKVEFNAPATKEQICEAILDAGFEL